MESTPRHQCLIYDGPPTRHLRSIAAVMTRKLAENHRCLYLNSEPMVAGMRSYLAAAGVDVTFELERGSLVLTAERPHLVNGHFDAALMMASLDLELKRALSDGYAGLWATGDMTWELGPERNPARLVEYERRLQEFLDTHPELGGICQYHAETLPRDLLRHGLEAHPAVFVNETLSMINPRYLAADTAAQPCD